MTVAGRMVLCAVALFLVAPSLVQAADPPAIPASPALVASPPLVTDEPIADSIGTCCDSTAVLPCAGTPLSVFVPNLAPGLQFNASVLLLKPGADNLGWSTITTYLPVQSPQWAVQNINPTYQPGFTFGATYVIPSSGKDIQTSWDHLRTSDSSSVAVSDPTTQWISPFNQTGPSTSEFYNQIGIFYLKSAQATQLRL